MVQRDPKEIPHPSALTMVVAKSGSITYITLLQRLTAAQTKDRSAGSRKCYPKLGTTFQSETSTPITRNGGTSSIKTPKNGRNLIETIGTHEIGLILLKGLITRRSRGSQSTLDLSSMSNSLVNSVTAWKPAVDPEASSDHIPFITQIQVESITQVQQQPRPQWKKADWEEVNRRLALKLSRLSTNRLELNFSDSVYQRLSAITQAIKEAIPTTRLSTFAKPYWTKECSEALKEARKVLSRISFFLGNMLVNL